MATVYVIQVWVFHGVGTQGWRTVRREFGGHPYRYRTEEAALVAMRQHFGNLAEGSSVRVHAVPDDEVPATVAEPREPGSGD